MKAETGLAPLIAVVGCDGSGKSTVSEALCRRLGGFGPARVVHLGIQSGRIGRALAGVPLAGRMLDRRIDARAARARAPTGSVPDALTATVIFLFALRRVRRFRRMIAARRRGVLVVTDRYPQTSVPGSFDGTGLSRARGARGYVGRLARREHALYDRMAGNRPDLVLRLNVDVETAFARKPDHRRESLARKIEALPRIDFGGAPIVDLDSLQPLDQVVAAAMRAVTRALGIPASGGLREWGLERR